MHGESLVTFSAPWCKLCYTMSSTIKIEKCLLADWGSNSPDIPVASEDTKVMPMKEANVAEEIACDRRPLEQQQGLVNNEENVPQEENSEGEDYSPSCSSWVPTDEDPSSDESDTKKTKRTKAIKMEPYIRHYAKRRNGKNIPTPVHRPNAVVNVLKERHNNVNNKVNNLSCKSKHKETRAGNCLLDSVAKPPKDPIPVETPNHDKQKILGVNGSFIELFKTVHSLKHGSESCTSEHFDNTPRDVPLSDNSVSNPVYNNIEGHEQSEKTQSEESNRSDDNGLITNKDSIAPESPVDEWIPIGSGKTLIHKDKYEKVKWKSLTIATRTLLLATFPRRVLATHSLTGKRSPAFQDRPAKMCLDPKIVLDIIIEITTKFKVKENSVRSIITTKCADECKMYKTRAKKKNKLSKNLEIVQRNPQNNLDLDE